MYLFLQADPRLKQNHKNVLLKTLLVGERTWTDFEPQDYSLNDYSVSKQLITLLRHGSLPREDDGAMNSGD